MADEEEVPDPKLVADEKCAKTMPCARLYVEYETCASRIEAKGHGECGPYYMDYLGCIDKCVRIARCPMRPHHPFKPCATPLSRLAAPSAQAKDEIFKATK